MYSKTAHSEMKRKSKNQRAKSSTRGKLTENSSKETEMKSRDRTKRESHHQNRNHHKVHKSKHLSKEKRENVSNPSGKKSSSRSKHKAEVFVKEITINNPRIKHDENLENAHKMKKHRSRSSENLNRSPKVKPEQLRREKTIHVEKMRKSSQSKPDSRNIKFVNEKKHDDKKIKRHRHKSSGEKKSNRMEDDCKQLLYYQVETNSPFRKVITNNTLPSHSPLRVHKEKAHKVKNDNRTCENISKRISSAQVHHKNRPKLVVGRKLLKYSIHEPSSSSDNKKNRKRHKKEINTQRDSQVKKNKKQPPAESTPKNITRAQPQLQDKIEDDLKSYFIRIQSLIDKKIDALLQNYKSKVKLKEASDGETVKPTAEADNGVNRHRHRSKSRKKVSRKCSDKEKHEAKLHSVERMERRFNSPVKRNYDFCGAPSRHSSPLKQKYTVSPRFCSPFWRTNKEMQRRPSTPPRNEETPPIIKRQENHRQCLSGGRNERSLVRHSSSDRRNIRSSQRHNSPVDRRCESYHRRCSSSGRNRETIVCVKEHDEKDNNVDRYVDLMASGSILPSKHIENKIKKIKPEKESYFRVQGIEPAKLLESGNKTPKKRPSRNLECKTVSIIGIPSQMKKHAFRKVDIAEDSVERKKKTKRFKLYYQYSRDLNYFDPDSGNSSEGRSVVSDSLRVISDDSECHIELCKMKKDIRKQSGPAKHFSALKTPQKLSDQSCIFSNRSTEGNITNREPGKYRHKPSVDLKLNNIIEEKTSVASSGEPRKFHLEIDCKYLKSLHSSSSDYGVRSRNKCNVLFQNEMIVNKREQAVPIKSREVNNDSTKPKRKRGLANVASRKIHNTKQKRKEQRVKLISKSDVDISYNSLIKLNSSSSASQKYTSPKCSRPAETVDGPNSRDFFPNVANARVYNESQTSLNWWKTDKQKEEIKQYLQNQQQIYFGIGTRLSQNYSPMEAFDEIGFDKVFLDKSTGFGEVNKKRSISANKNDEHSSSILRKIYYLIENQNREGSDADKDVKRNFRQEKEVQAVCNKKDEEISTKDLPSQSDDFGNQYSAEQNDEKDKNKFDVNDVITQKTSARDVGTDMDKFRFRNSETDGMSQKIDVGIEVRRSDTEKHRKCLSAIQVSKTDIAVEVGITNKPPREKLVDSRHKNKDSNVAFNVKRPIIPKKSSNNHFSKSNEGNRSKSVLPKNKRDKPEIKKGQSTVFKDTRNYHSREKPSSAKASPLKNKEVPKSCSHSTRSDSKSTVKSKIPTSKKHAPVDKKSKTEEKPCTQLCDKFEECSNLNESQSEISFRDIIVDSEESKITSLVCLHNYINVIKYDSSSKSNTHSLDHYPNSEHQERCGLFLTKEYKSSEVSAYRKRKDYDDSMRRRKRRKAGIRRKNNLAPQVYEVRFLTVDNLHSSLVKNENTTEKNDLFKTSYENTLASTPPECGHKSNLPKCFFEGSFNKTDFTKYTQSKLCEFYQKIVDRQGSSLAYERSNIIINEGKSVNFQGNYDHRLPGQKDVDNFLDCLCKHLISNKLADSFPEIDESFKKVWSVYDNMNLKGEDPPSKTMLTTEDEKTVEFADVSKKDIIAHINSSDEDPVPNINIDQDNGGFVDDTEYLHDRKLVVTGNLSCPILRAPDSSFDYLYQTSSSEKLSTVGTFMSPRKPVNNILGFALNGNTSHKRLKPLIKNSLVELDLEAPCSVESGYSSTQSKNNLSVTNFFKNPKIAALMEQQNDNWFCSDENIHLQEAISFTPGFTDYKIMTKQCQEYAQKVTNYSKTKIGMDEVYEEIPLEKLLGKRNPPNLMKFRSDSSIIEKEIEAERKESAQSDPTNSIPSGKRRYIHENFDHNTDFHQYELSLPSGDHIHNNHHVSVIYENMAGIQTGRVKGNDTEVDTAHKNQVMESESIENVELIKPESNTDIKLLTKILDSHIVLSSTNLNTHCITIVEYQNLGENDDGKNTLSGNENADESFKHGEDECNETEKHLSNCNLLNYENSRKFKSIICKKFFENLLEVYEKEIAVGSALLQDNDFLENELLSFLGGNYESHAASKKKSTVKNRIKGFIKKVFGLRNREETENVSYHETERAENVLTSVDADYQEKLQSLAGGAHKYFSMFVQAVENNHEINDEIKICGLCKLLQRIENGYFRFLRGVEKVNFEEEIRGQIKKAFIEIYFKASAEAKMMHRKLSSNDIHMIATFVCKYRIGLLSRTDIIASYIGQGFLRSDQQLKAAVISLMKRPDIDLHEYQTYLL